MMEIGERKNKWLICNYYREHSLLGVSGSNSLELQSLKFNQFLAEMETVPDHKNLVILGDFNINLMEDSNSNNNELKDSLLDRLPLLGLTQTVRNNTRHSLDHQWTVTPLLWHQHIFHPAEQHINT